MAKTMPHFTREEWQSILDQMQAASDPDQRTEFEKEVMRKIEVACKKTKSTKEPSHG
jgi:hypothetical protein